MVAKAGTTVTRVRYEIDMRSTTRSSYLQLADQIREKIASGEFAPDEPIPSLNQLSQESGLAVKTVQHALQVLKDEGLIYAVPGRRTYVSPPD